MRAAQDESSPHEVVVELLGRDLLAPEEVVGGGITLRGLSRRNANVLVERRAGPALFVKRARSTEESAAEAERCRRLAASGLDRFVPAVRLSDPDSRLLVLEGFPDAVDLKAFHLAGVRQFVGLFGLIQSCFPCYWACRVPLGAG